MTNREIGRAYIEDARIILNEAEASLSQDHYHRAVRKCQESVEMALKGLLRRIGPSSIRSLAATTQRDYRNVYDDLQLLLKAGLVEKDVRNRVTVPWDKIQTEIDLAA